MLPLKYTLIYALGSSVGALEIIVNLYMNIFLLEQVQLSPYYVAIILMINKTLDAINDPIIGYVSDNTSTPVGRRRPWLFFSIFMSGAMYILLWVVPSSDSCANNSDPDGCRAFYYLVMYGIFDFFVSIYKINYDSYTSEMSIDYDSPALIVGTKIVAYIIFASCATISQQKYLEYADNTLEDQRLRFIRAAIVVACAFMFLSMIMASYAVERKNATTIFHEYTSVTLQNMEEDEEEDVASASSAAVGSGTGTDSVSAMKERDQRFDQRLDHEWKADESEYNDATPAQLISNDIPRRSSEDAIIEEFTNGPANGSKNTGPAKGTPFRRHISIERAAVHNLGCCGKLAHFFRCMWRDYLRVLSNKPYMALSGCAVCISIVTQIMQATLQLYVRYVLRGSEGDFFNTIVRVQMGVLSGILVIMIAWRMLRIDKRNMLVMTLLAWAATCFALVRVHSVKSSAQKFVEFFFGMCMAVTAFLVQTMIPDIINHGHSMNTSHQRQDATYYSFFGVFQKIGVAIALGIVNIALGAAGFDPAAMIIVPGGGEGERDYSSSGVLDDIADWIGQPMGVRRMLHVIFSVFSGIMLLLAIIPLWFYNLRRPHANVSQNENGDLIFDI